MPKMLFLKILFGFSPQSVGRRILTLPDLDVFGFPPGRAACQPDSLPPGHPQGMGPASTISPASVFFPADPKDPPSPGGGSLGKPPASSCQVGPKQ